MGEVNKTPFTAIYNDFFSRVTDDMYMIWTERDTYKDLQDILLVAIPRFEFPRFDIFDYELGYLQETEKEDGTSDLEWIGGSFNTELTREEVNILSLSMIVEWFGRQIATTDLTKEKYSGSDFKFTSQANHISKLKVMQDTYRQECFHLQRLYKRRKRTDDGQIQSTMGQIMSTPSYGWKI